MGLGPPIALPGVPIITSTCPFTPSLILQRYSPVSRSTPRRPGAPEMYGAAHVETSGNARTNDANQCADGGVACPGDCTALGSGPVSLELREHRHQRRDQRHHA